MDRAITYLSIVEIRSQYVLFTLCSILFPMCMKSYVSTTNFERDFEFVVWSGVLRFFFFQFVSSTSLPSWKFFDKMLILSFNLNCHEVLFFSKSLFCLLFVVKSHAKFIKPSEHSTKARNRCQRSTRFLCDLLTHHFWLPKHVVPC